MTSEPVDAEVIGYAGPVNYVKQMPLGSGFRGRKTTITPHNCVLNIASQMWSSTSVMDRGIPTEKVLEDMRTADPPVYYLVGTPRGRLTKLERALLPLPWQAVRAASA